MPPWIIPQAPGPLAGPWYLVFCRRGSSTRSHVVEPLSKLRASLHVSPRLFAATSCSFGMLLCNLEPFTRLQSWSQRCWAASFRPSPGCSGHIQFGSLPNCLVIANFAAIKQSCRASASAVRPASQGKPCLPAILISYGWYRGPYILYTRRRGPDPTLQSF